MILDRVSRSALYVPLHPGFARAFEFLARPGLADLPPGRIELDGARLYASVSRDEGRGQAGARLEAHRKYIDIQYVVAGDERIGWESLDACRGTALGFDEAKDIEFYARPPASWFAVPPGHFAIFFPSDAHAPLAGAGAVSKIVLKVAVQ